MARPTHGYELDGEPLPGSTTITGMLNKPALVGWAGKTMLAYARQHARSCYTAGVAGEEPPGLPRWTDILYRTRDTAALAGTCGHEAAQAWLAGESAEEAMEQAVNADKVDLPDEAKGEAMQGGREALASFLEYWEGRRFELVDMEVPLISSQYRYGTTYDLLVKSHRGHELVELKTGGIYPEHLLQMSAQAHALSECRGIEVVRHNAVRITRAKHPDVHEHSFSDLSEAFVAFRHLRRVYDLMKQVEERL